MIRETNGQTTSQVTDVGPSDAEVGERHQPDIQVYSDALLLADALERHDVDDLADQETDALVNLCTYLVLAEMPYWPSVFARRFCQELILFDI